MERHAQQSLLTAGPDAICDIQKRRRLRSSILYDANATRLLDDERARITSWCSQVDGTSELSNLLEPDRCCLGRFRGFECRWPCLRIVAGQEDDAGSCH
jgi:hypothetical protein